MKKENAVALADAPINIDIDTLENLRRYFVARPTSPGERLGEIADL